MNDCWKDREGKVVPDPRPVFQRMAMADRAFFHPDSFKITDPRQVGARISTLQHDDEDEQAARRRRAVESAMADAQLTGLGVVRISDGGASVEHIPESTFRGGGGSFDGGGASGDYTPAPSSCDSSSSSSTDTSSSCSSSDSGGGSSSD